MVATRDLPAAEAKCVFKDVLDAAERGEETLILRHGKPVAVISPAPQPPPPREAPPVEPTAAEISTASDFGAFLRTLPPPLPLPKPKKPGGLLSMVGLFDDWDTMEEDMAEIVASRQTDIPRPPPDFGDG